MVTNITSLTGNGLKDWLIQRVSALYFVLYLMSLLLFFLIHQPLDYFHWHGLFQHSWFKIASVLALISFSLHSWIGLWTVTTDYLSCSIIRLSVQLLVLMTLLVQFIAGLIIIWG